VAAEGFVQSLIFAAGWLNAYNITTDGQLW
jgi:hypothetical protein